MGFLDKVKTQAASATSLAKDAAHKGQARLDAVQAQRVADDLLRDLGALTYSRETGRSTPTADVDEERLVSALQEHEKEHGPISVAIGESPASPPSDRAPSPASSASPSTGEGV